MEDGYESFKVDLWRDRGSMVFCKAKGITRTKTDPTMWAIGKIV